MSWQFSLRFTAAQWSNGLASVLELISLGSLYLTKEVPSWIFGGTFIAWLAARFVTREINRHAQVGLFLLLIASTLYLWLDLGTHPIVAAAYAAPAAHALLWFSPRTAVYRGWRMGLGFIELILCSGLTADVYLPLMISLYIVLAATALSCDFMDRELARRAPEERASLLGGSYIRNSIGLSLMIFLTAALIFPVLPRPRVSGTGTDLTAGYTESVNVGSWSRIRQSEGGETLLRLFTPNDVELSTDLYLGLLRSRTLDAFNGKEWFAQPSPERYQPTKHPSTPAAIRIEVIREPMGSTALPVPYGTRSANVTDGDYTFVPFQTRNGDWIAPGFRSRRVGYRLEIVPNDLRYLKERAAIDPPRAVHSAVPDSIKSEPLIRLSQKLFAGVTDPQEKVRRVLAYFRSEGFSATDSSQSDASAIDAQLRKSRLNPVEQFLFVTKQGHCEWFATSSALLLRMGGVPTRLVAGFRITRSSLAGILTVKSSDAHAWIEAYIPNRGWLPVDSTPKMSTSFGFMDRARQLSDLFGAYWFKYIVSFSDESSPSRIFKDLRGWLKDTLKGGKPAQARPDKKPESQTIFTSPLILNLIVGALSAFLLYWFFIVRRRGRDDGAHPRLRAERLRLARALGMKDLDFTGPLADLSNTTLAAAIEKWRERYLLARFGERNHRADTEKLLRHASELQALTQEIKLQLRKSAEVNAPSGEAGGR